MTCWRIENLLAPFLDGELPEAESGAMADHLEHCEACAEKVETVAAMPDLVPPVLSEYSAPLMAHFDDRLKQRIASSENLVTGTSVAEHGAESLAWGIPSPAVTKPSRSSTTLWMATACIGLLIALIGSSWLTQQRIDLLEQSITERDQLIQRLEQQVVASRFDPRVVPDAAASGSVPVFLPSAAPTPQTLPAGVFVPVSYGMASIDSPRIVR